MREGEAMQPKFFSLSDMQVPCAEIAQELHAQFGGAFTTPASFLEHMQKQGSKRGVYDPSIGILITGLLVDGTPIFGSTFLQEVQALAPSLIIIAHSETPIAILAEQNHPVIQALVPIVHRDNLQAACQKACQQWETQSRPLRALNEAMSELRKTRALLYADQEKRSLDLEPVKNMQNVSHLPLNAEVYNYTALKKQRSDAFEREFLAASLARHKGNVSSAAREARLDRSNYLRLLRRHGMKSDQFRMQEKQAA